MYTARRPTELEVPPTLVHMRHHVALVRALLDEFDRIASSLPARSARAAQKQALGEQLAEELRRLGSTMIECADEVCGAVPQQASTRTR